LVIIDFDPTIGHEQSGRRPAVIISETAYNDQSSCCVVCPITNNIAPWPFKVILPNDSVVSGAILVDQIKCVDRRRILRSIGDVAPALLFDVRSKLAALVGLSLEAEGGQK
ncbi:MAG: type II toxin-antitoxin system PemK/MazF family toxin, partial [Bosea sp. (in: a-proteobacteria)]